LRVILKTLESPSLLSDLKRLKKKVDGGADYGYPNVFLNAKYFDFVAKAREIGITVLLFRVSAIGGAQTFANFTANFQDRFTRFN
jgi:5,10-methylenetetrahydrofolate reductase